MKITLTKINFCPAMKEKIRQSAMGGLLQQMGVDTDELPEKMKVVVDTSKIIAVSEPMTLKVAGDKPAFKIYFGTKSDESWDIVGEEYDDFIQKWAKNEENGGVRAVMD